MFVVRCRVRGGITGDRTSICKQNREVIYFDTREEAQKYADVQIERTERSHSPAIFSYWVEEVNQV